MSTGRNIDFIALYNGKEFGDAVALLNALAAAVDVGVRKRLPPLIKAALLTYLQKTAATIVVRSSAAWAPSPPPGPLTGLYKRSGETNKAIIDSVKVSGSTVNNIQGVIGGPFWLRVHEYGATIRAKGNGWLTIPLPAALDGRGVPLKRSAREWSDTFFQRSRAGNLLIFQKRGPTIIPLYILKKSVVIPPRLGMTLTLDQFAKGFLQDVLIRIQKEFFTELLPHG